MSATALPLPLELTQPVPLAADLDTLLAARLGADSSKYDPETQVRPGVTARGGSHTNSHCVNHGLFQIDDANFDPA